MSIIPSHVRAICFDAVGTLIFPDPPAHVVYAEMGRQFGSRLTPDVIRERFRRAFAEEEQRDLAWGLQTSEERERQRWWQIVSTVLDDVTNASACFTRLYQHFSRADAWCCGDHVGPILWRLSTRFPLALASNYDHRLRSVVDGLTDLRPISQLFISSEIGWRKPAAPFFGAICNTLALPPKSVLYVGDDPINDFDGARAAGLEALLFLPDGPAPAGLACVSNLTELDQSSDSNGD
jgi:putative hydrolase of the HAD superfamily